MTASPTIDLVNMTNVASVKKNGSSYSSTAKNSNEFENALNDANQTYSKKDEGTTETKVEKQPVSEEKNTQTVENTEENDKTQPSNKKVKENSKENHNEENSDNSSDENAAQAEENADADEKLNVENEPESKEQTPMKTQTSECENQNKEKVDFQALKENLLQGAKQENADSQVAETVESVNVSGQVDEALIDAQPQPVNFEALIQNLVTDASSESAPKEPTKEAETVVVPAKEAATPVLNVQVEPTIVVSNLVEADANTQAAPSDSTVILNNLANNANPNALSGATTNTQTQQVLSNLLPSEPTQNAPAQADTSAAPLIQVSEKVISELGDDVQVSSDTKPVDVLNKTNLTQEMLDNTNAKVVSVEKQNSPQTNLNNNSFGQQNAQEQAVKLQLGLDVADDTPQQPVVQQVAQPAVQAQENAAAVNLETQSILSKPSVDSTGQTQAQPQAQFAQVPKEINQNDVIVQINRNILSRNIQEMGTTKINMVLNPEHLGKVSIELVNSKEGLTAYITAENDQVKEMLSKSTDNLKDNLGQQGVQVNNVTVKVAETQEKSNDMLSFEQQMEQGKKQNQNQNAKGVNQQFSLDEDTVDSAEEVIEPQDTAKTESTVSISGQAGKVDYKV